MRCFDCLVIDIHQTTVFCACASRKQRPTAKELLRHPFIKKAKKTSYLSDLIEKYRVWKEAGGNDDDSSDDSDM